MNLIFFSLITFLSIGAHAQLMDPRFMLITPPVETPQPSSEILDVTTTEERSSYYIKKNTDKHESSAHVKKQKETKRSITNNSQSTNTESSLNESPSQVSAADVSSDNKNFGSQVRDIMFGGDLEKIEKQRSSFEKNDIRKNIFDLSIGTFYFYNHSQSNYYFRNYLSSSPGAFVGLDLWVTPYFGFNTNYKFTLLNSVKDSPSTESYAAANHDWLAFGLKFRRFSGSEFETSSFTIGLNYVDKKFDAPASSSYRLKSRSRGPEISLDLSTPSSKVFLWNFGISVQPYVLHEESAALVNIKSGSSNQTMGFGLNLGGEYRMSRSMRTFFKFSADLYRTQFSGNALATDPISQSVPSNIAVNDLYYFFNIGLIFGR